LVHGHVIDDDFVVCRSEESGKLLIQAAYEVAAFKVVEIPEFRIRLGRNIARAKREGVHSRACDVANKEDVVVAKCEHAG
jgi:hypothetical protein